jgi:HSP20 family protein
MLMRTDPFRDLDRITSQLLGTTAAGTWSRPNPMPLDAWRSGDEFVVCFDLPGVSLDAIDIDVERNVLTVKAERSWVPAEGDQVLARERSHGSWTRQIRLGDGLATDRLEAHYEDGVLRITVPVAEQAKARTVEITTADRQPLEVGASN